MTKSEIKIEVTLDENRHPSEIKWRADDSNQKENHSKAMLLSFFDKESLETLKIDLWTNDMQIDEMDRFFFNTLKSMADTYYRSTNNQKLASQMQSFAHFFGQEIGIIDKDQNQ